MAVAVLFVRVANKLAHAESIKSAELVRAALGRRLELLPDILLSQELELLSSLPDFLCSWLWPFCSKGLPTNLSQLTMSIDFTKLVRATLGRLPELLQDVFLSQSIWVALEPL